jgi:general secretion pathway protein A
MYERFYGLHERPFGLTSNLKYLLLTPKHQEALSNLDYGITSGNGITLLLGEAGTGKTTLLRKAHARCLHRTATPTRWAYVNNPMLSRDEFFDSIADAFQLDSDLVSSKSRFLRELERALTERRQAGTISVLVVDEAQSLPYALLEELRLLANIETDTEKLLRVVLAGQPAFGETLTDARLGQLKQRIGLRCVLPALSLRETAAYIAHRIVLAGGDPARAFSREAVMLIHERSQGIPRTINVICENALLTGFAADERPVGPQIVLEVCGDFDLLPRAGSPLQQVGTPQASTTTGPIALAGEEPANMTTAPAGAVRRLALPHFTPRRR